MTQTLEARTELLEEPARERRPVGRAAARGAIAAMAMSGFRQLTTSLGLVRKTPPEAMIERTAPPAFQRVPVRYRSAVVESVHWLYGAGGGAVYALLPESVRRRPWAGPVFGVLTWALFQGALAPALGLPHKRGPARERVALLADHVLYGVVVATSPWPHEPR